MTINHPDRRINIVVTQYEGDEFPEAAHYNEYVAEMVAAAYPGFAVDVSYGLRTAAYVYGVSDETAAEMGDWIVSAAKVEHWEQFCSDGYLQYSEESAS